jgi:hypothetical protein
MTTEMQEGDRNGNRKGCRRFQLGIGERWFGKSLLHGADALTQAGLVARRRIGVQCALLDRFVENRHGFTVQVFSSGFVALAYGLAQVAQLRAQTGGVGAITGGSTFGLTGALQRRKMICHVWFVTFVCLESYSGRSESMIIREQLFAGQTDGSPLTGFSGEGTLNSMVVARPWGANIPLIPVSEQNPVLSVWQSAHRCALKYQVDRGSQPHVGY